MRFWIWKSNSFSPYFGCSTQKIGPNSRKKIKTSESIKKDTKAGKT